MPTIELDNFKDVWKEINRSLERQHALALHQSKETKLTGLRHGLHSLRAGQFIQLLTGVVLTGMSAEFWLNHLSVPHLAVWGLLLHAYGLMLIIFAARDLALIHRIDYGAPVVAIQRQIATLREWRLRAGLWFGIAGCFIWVPFLLMIFYWLGADIWVVKPQVVYWFLANGFFCLLAASFLVRISTQKNRIGSLLREQFIGRSVRRAQAVLEEIENFERA